MWASVDNSDEQVCQLSHLRKHLRAFGIQYSAARLRACDIPEHGHASRHARSHAGGRNPLHAVTSTPSQSKMTSSNFTRKAGSLIDPGRDGPVIEGIGEHAIEPEHGPQEQ